MGSVQTIINLGSAMIKVPANGYAYIYVCNQSCNPVYIDNFQVVHEYGRILEENHYYAYGLKIAGISSRAFGAPKNPYQYQGDYSEFDEETGWNDFELRSYDAQTGRFMQQDPYGQFASGYMGMGNNPVNMVDPGGGFSVPGAVIGGVAGFMAGGAYALANDKNPVTGALIGAAGGVLLGGLNGIRVASAVSAVGKVTQVTRYPIQQEINHGEQSDLGKEIRDILQTQGIHNGAFTSFRLILKKIPQINPNNFQENTIGGYMIEDETYSAKGTGFYTQFEARPKGDNGTFLWAPNIHLNENTFKDYLNDGVSWALLVRMVYHEFIHVSLYNGTSPDVSRPLSSSYSNFNVHETIAHYHMMYDVVRGLPEMSFKEKQAYARGYLKNFYPGLPKEWAKYLAPMIEYFKSFK